MSEVPADTQYASFEYALAEIEHRYGEGVHLLSSPVLHSQLVRLCAPQTVQPQINELVTAIYKELVTVVVNHAFPRRTVTVPTRMIGATPRGVYKGQVVDPDQRAVVVNIARAGTLPSHVCYGALNYLIDPQFVRQDHIIMQRTVDAQERVTGAATSGQKIGGSIDDCVVIFPDPMGATGSSINRVLSLYREQVEGTPRALIALHLIVTPEYIRAVKTANPDAVIYAIRLDRGLSPADVLQTIPGTEWDREVGLTEKQYIVPGGGGFGEILNNAYE